MSPRFLSLFTGIGGFDRGLEAAGWECSGQVEIDPFCNRVLERRWPRVRRWQDVRAYGQDAGGREAAGDAGGAGLRAERGEPLGRGAPVDLLVGGFPCQGTSVAGKRLGLADDRTALFWEILRVQEFVGAPWALLENVPGLRSVGLGHDFATVVAALAERWPAVGWRALDSRFFHVAQRRERVFFVCGPSEARVAEVLLELAGGLGDREAGGEARPDAATRARLGADLARSLSRVGGGDDPGAGKGTLVAGPLLSAEAGAGFRTGAEEAVNGHLVVSEAVSSKWAKQSGGPAGDEAQNLVLADPISANEGSTYSHEGKQRRVRLHNVVAFKPSHFSRGKDGAPSEIAPPLSADADRGDQDAVIFEPRFARNGRGAPEPIAPPLKAQSGQTGKGDAAPVVAFHEDQRTGAVYENEHTHALAQPGGKPGQGYQAVREGSAVRRLTPLECERLQGFPDGWSCLCQAIEAYHGAEDVDEVALRCRCPDGPRYRALGNAVTVNVAAWIGRRILEVL